MFFNRRFIRFFLDKSLLTYLRRTGVEHIIVSGNDFVCDFHNFGKRSRSAFHLRGLFVNPSGSVIFVRRDGVTGHYHRSLG